MSEMKRCPGCEEVEVAEDFLTCEVCGKDYCQNCMSRKVIGVDDYLDICDACEERKN